MHKMKPLLLLFLVVLAIAPIKSQAEQGKIYHFAIVPQQAATKLAHLWVPVMQYLEQETAYRFKFVTARNIPAFEQGLGRGDYDFSYMNPYHYVRYHKQAGYQAFARVRDKQIHGIIVTHKEAPYQSLEDLANKRLAFPSPLAFAASMLPRAELKQRGIPFAPVYVSSHDSVYLNVAARNFIAGGGVMRTFNNIDAKVRDQLRILYKTPGYTPHAFAARADIPGEVIIAVQKALQSMEQDSYGQGLLKQLGFKGITTARDSDWDDIRQLDFQ